MELSELSKVSLKPTEILQWLLTHGEVSLVGDVWSANVDLSMPLIPWLRAFVADVLKIMLFSHVKSLLYYFTTSFYNIPFIRCFIIQSYTLK